MWFNDRNELTDLSHVLCWRYLNLIVVVIVIPVVVVVVPVVVLVLKIKMEVIKNRYSTLL